MAREMLETETTKSSAFTFPQTTLSTQRFLVLLSDFDSLTTISYCYKDFPVKWTPVEENTPEVTLVATLN